MLRKSHFLIQVGTVPQMTLPSLLVLMKLIGFLISRQFEEEYIWRKEKTRFDLLCGMHSCQVYHKTCRIYLGVFLCPATR